MSINSLSPVNETEGLRKGREVSEVDPVNLRAEWKVVIKLVKSTLPLTRVLHVCTRQTQCSYRCSGEGVGEWC